MRLLFEAFPIALAMVAIIFSLRRALLTTDKYVRHSAFLGAACAVILIAAQTSWSWSVYAGNRFGEDFANCLWTVFNILSMTAVIYASWKGSK